MRDVVIEKWPDEINVQNVASLYSVYAMWEFTTNNPTAQKFPFTLTVGETGIGSKTGIPVSPTLLIT